MMRAHKVGMAEEREQFKRSLQRVSSELKTFKNKQKPLLKQLNMATASGKKK